jgi:hypothetical protein
MLIFIGMTVAALICGLIYSNKSAKNLQRMCFDFYNAYIAFGDDEAFAGFYVVYITLSSPHRALMNQAIRVRGELFSLSATADNDQALQPMIERKEEINSFMIKLDLQPSSTKEVIRVRLKYKDKYPQLLKSVGRSDAYFSKMMLKGLKSPDYFYFLSSIATSLNKSSK